jgi:hypothetical protein
MSQSETLPELPRYRSLVSQPGSRPAASSGAPRRVRASQVLPQPVTAKPTLPPPPPELPRDLEKLAVIATPRAGIGVFTPIAHRYGWAGHLVEAPVTGAGRSQPDISRLADTVPPGAFLAGPISHGEPSIAALERYRKILLVRDLRAILVSRFCLERQLQRHAALTPVWYVEKPIEQMCLFLGKFGHVLFDEILSILPWLTEPGTLVLRHEELLAPGEPLMRALAAILRRETRPADEVQRLHAVPRKITARRHFATYWSSEAEGLFTAFGGPKMNHLLGYEKAA